MGCFCSARCIVLGVLSSSVDDTSICCVVLSLLPPAPDDVEKLTASEVVPEPGLHENRATNNPNTSHPRSKMECVAQVCEAAGERDTQSKL